MSREVLFVRVSKREALRLASLLRTRAEAVLTTTEERDLFNEVAKSFERQAETTWPKRKKKGTGNHGSI